MEQTSLLSPTTKALSDKRARSRSTLVSILFHALLLLIALYVVVFQSTPKPEVAFIPPDPQRPKLEPRKLEMKVRVNQLTKRSSRPKPRPRMMVKAPSDLALPEIKKNPRATNNKLQRNFSTLGTSGFGAGVGGGFGSGMGGGMGGMGIDFMGAKSTGTRFAFVIDHSKSLKPAQLAVVKYELYSALEKIGPNGLATVLFFSGPVWRPDQDAKAVREDWKGDQKKGWFLKEDAPGPEPKWFYPGSDNLAAMERMIYETPNTGGTDWYHPLKFVLEMDPAPDVVFFMTDGQVPGFLAAKTFDMVSDLPKDQVVINTVVFGMSEEKADTLRKIAEITKGEFRNYTKSELKKMAADLPETPDDFSTNTIEYVEGGRGPGIRGPLGWRLR